MLIKIQGRLGKVFLRKKTPFGYRQAFSTTPTQIHATFRPGFRGTAFALTCLRPAIPWRQLSR
jgi:hypothetical protein